MPSDSSNHLAPVSVFAHCLCPMADRTPGKSKANGRRGPGLTPPKAPRPLESQSDVTVHHYFQYSRRDGGNGGNGAADLDREVTPRFEYGSPEWHRFCDSVINSRFHNDQAVDFVRNMERYRVLVNSLFRPDEVVTERERRVRILEALFGLLVLLLHSASNHGTVTFDDIDIINCQLSMNQGRMVSHSHIQDSEFMLSWCIFLYNINIKYWNYII